MKLLFENFRKFANEGLEIQPEPLEIKLLQKVLDKDDEMTPEEAKKQLPIDLHQKFDHFLQKNLDLQAQGGVFSSSDHMAEPIGLEEQ